MLVQHAEEAHIQIVLVSDDMSRIQTMRDDLECSEIEYFLVCLSDSEYLVSHLGANLKYLVGRTPTIVIFDYNFLGLYTESIFDVVETPTIAPVEFIILDAPSDRKIRERFQRVGVTLHDSVPQSEKIEISVH